MLKGNEKDCICEKPNGKHKRYCDAYRLSNFLTEAGGIMTSQEKSKCCGAGSKPCEGKPVYKFYHPQGDCSKCGKPFTPAPVKEECKHKYIENNMMPDTCRDCGRVLVEEEDISVKENYHDSMTPEEREVQLKIQGTMTYATLNQEERCLVCGDKQLEGQCICDCPCGGCGIIQIKETVEEWQDIFDWIRSLRMPSGEIQIRNIKYLLAETSNKEYEKGFIEGQKHAFGIDKKRIIAETKKKIIKKIKGAKRNHKHDRCSSFEEIKRIFNKI